MQAASCKLEWKRHAELGVGRLHGLLDVESLSTDRLKLSLSQDSKSGGAEIVIRIDGSKPLKLIPSYFPNLPFPKTARICAPKKGQALKDAIQKRVSLTKWPPNQYSA